jgi:hypothetical protein
MTDQERMDKINVLFKMHDLKCYVDFGDAVTRSGFFTLWRAVRTSNSAWFWAEETSTSIDYIEQKAYQMMMEKNND